MHYHYIEDERGDLVEVVPFCSDACHRAWCAETGAVYGGWNGCQEGADSAEFCANCGTFAGGTAACECQTDNVVVNRFASKEGEKCPHGNWVQLPADYLEVICYWL